MFNDQVRAIGFVIFFVGCELEKNLQSRARQ